MKRCDLCRKRVWFWQAGIDSRFGWTHFDCFDRKMREEFWENVREIVTAFVVWYVKYRLSRVHPEQAHHERATGHGSQTTKT